MPSYFSPGVYVEEIPSAIQAIAGVGTSTAGFIGIVPDEGVTVPVSSKQVINELVKAGFPLANYPVNTDSFTVKVDGTDVTDAKLENDVTAQKALIQFATPPASSATVLVDYLGDIKAESIDVSGGGTEFALAHYPAKTETGSFQVRVNDKPAADATLVNDDAAEESLVKFTATPPADAIVLVDYIAIYTGETVKVSDGASGQLRKYSVNDADGTYEVRVNGAVDKTAKLVNDTGTQTAKVAFTTAPAAGAQVLVDYVAEYRTETFKTAIEVNKPILCTNFSEFSKQFGGFSTDTDHRNLVHAVFGFFRNGGTRCFVVRMLPGGNIDDALTNLAAVDEVAIVAAPGMTGADVRASVTAHCAIDTQDRFAIFDSTEEISGAPTIENIKPPPNSDYAAFYFPWLQVADPATKIQNPKGEGRIHVPPSGHMAGIYARVDTRRGVHKAPANEPVMGALNLKYQISKAQQDGLNPLGINCIRELNGNIRVWGARTVGGNDNGEWRYINIRRTFLFLRESIDEGMQWAVFEPNDEKLWAKITRNTTAFLNTVWRSGALFGSTPDQAFYVKCDAETNPPELREIGQVVTEIGVAVVRPAEFVIFRISQWQPEQA